MSRLTAMDKRQIRADFARLTGERERLEAELEAARFELAGDGTNTMLVDRVSGLVAKLKSQALRLAAGREAFDRAAREDAEK